MTYRSSKTTYTYKTIGPFFGDIFYYPPDSSSFLIEGATSGASISNINGGLLLEAPATSGSANLTLFSVSTPPPPYTLKVCLAPLPSVNYGNTFNTFGIYVKGQDGGIRGLNNYRSNNLLSTDVGRCELSHGYQDSYNVFNRSSFWYDTVDFQSLLGNPYIWLSVSNTGNTGNSGYIKHGVGLDSRNIYNIGTSDVTTWTSPINKMGIFIKTNASEPVRAIIQSWQILNK